MNDSLSVLEHQTTPLNTTQKAQLEKLHIINTQPSATKRTPLQKDPPIKLAVCRLTPNGMR